MMEKSVFLGARIKLFCFLFTPRFVVVISFEFARGRNDKKTVKCAALIDVYRLAEPLLGALINCWKQQTLSWIKDYLSDHKPNRLIESDVHNETKHSHVKVSETIFPFNASIH